MRRVLCIGGSGGRCRRSSTAISAVVTSSTLYIGAVYTVCSRKRSFRQILHCSMMICYEIRGLLAMYEIRGLLYVLNSSSSSLGTFYPTSGKKFEFFCGQTPTILRTPSDLDTASCKINNLSATIDVFDVALTSTKLRHYSSAFCVFPWCLVHPSHELFFYWNSLFIKVRPSELGLGSLANSEAQS